MAWNDAMTFNPTALPSGTRVGSWQLLGWQGRGTYGTVYRATPWGKPGSEVVALKLASHPRDERFVREAELLSRLHSPNVPCLLDYGFWRHPSGRAYPYLVMEWIDGTSLYEWARQQSLSSRQAFTLLAQVARALAETVAVGGTHRDVKGDNILVRSADGCAFLMDYGAGHYVGAAPLTPPPFPPGSPRYRSPEAWAFSRSLGPSSCIPYPSQPADDVFALGVTAYKLVTDEYPPSTFPEDEESRVWSLEAGGPRPPQAMNPSVVPHLGALILRMLAVRPEARGAPSELAEALEQAAAHVSPEADQPLFSGVPRPRARWPSEDLVVAPQWPSPEPELLPERSSPPVEARSHRAWILTMGVGVPLAVCTGWGVCVNLQAQLPVTSSAFDGGERDGGSVALGDTSLTVAASSSAAPFDGEGIGLEAPPSLLPRQSRPDAKGRCPTKGHVVLNGGCWVKLDVTHPACQGNVYVYQGSCYVPALQPATVPTSSPAEARPPKH
ncbi:serine/threonine-protein kinase [Stigmatella sp. ncwal1]|uniref:Serine/threonine-protein kinase n=1 Tax=Stigmatella ashevillensis TaxID=2995309 RepID=A0ABT5DCQ0_9BACT|nr:serine/threonine-protein kinase [Stigmatella ashevillena]MDC0710900.1 serine/threonine-protein kinase [Stigmatella ashevillena]